MRRTRQERLNRTSVGLKQVETDNDHQNLNCLNRTSVGLKPEDKNGIYENLHWPQSNQRGIETNSL